MVGSNSKVVVYFCIFQTQVYYSLTALNNLSTNLINPHGIDGLVIFFSFNVDKTNLGCLYLQSAVNWAEGCVIWMRKDCGSELSFVLTEQSLQ